ncbi:hypothetical protein Q9Q99_00220 [Curtobacterium flaccumfaciens]|nr:hypothetical protein Q9Q99_00220 [Curtobacterium flaccumfaciens]
MADRNPLAFPEIRQLANVVAVRTLSLCESCQLLEFLPIATPVSFDDQEPSANAGDAANTVAATTPLRRLPRDDD